MDRPRRVVVGNAAAMADGAAGSSLKIGAATLVRADCREWLAQRAACSVHAVVTDPPYGLREYNAQEQAKLRAGKGGVWRIPPALGGCKRMPVPRFTTLSMDEQAAMSAFFATWAAQVLRVLVPGGHVFVAANPLVSHLIYMPMLAAGFEKRGEVIRLVQTLRGGDRPKNAHAEFTDVTVMPRSAWEPWGLFRKPCEGIVQSRPAQVEDGRAAARVGGAAVHRCHPVRADVGGGAGDRRPPVAQADQAVMSGLL